MDNAINALVSGEVEISPTPFPWMLLDGKSCEAHLVSWSVRQNLQYITGVDTCVDLVIALPSLGVAVALGLFHVYENKRCSWATISALGVKGQHRFSYDIHSKNISDAFKFLALPLTKVSMDESHSGQDGFGFAWHVEGVSSEG